MFYLLFVNQRTQLLQQWAQIKAADADKKTVWDTGFPIDALKYIGMKSVQIPDGFVLIFQFNYPYLFSQF